MNSDRKPLWLYSFFFLLMAAGCVFQKGDLPAFLQNSDPSMKPTKISAQATPAATATPFVIDGFLPTARPGEIRQWAVKASSSSEFLDERWSAMQATGKPDTLACVDSVKAWAAANQNTIEWIDLEYEQAVIPAEINIYQNYNPSQVTEVAVFTNDGEKHIVWEGYPEKVKDCPDRMSITVDLNFHKPVRLVRITLDQRVNGWGWNEIDAVELTGVRP